MRNQSRLTFRSIFRVKASNPKTGALIGYVGDVSEFGFKLLSDSQIEPGTRMNLRMRMRLTESEQLQIDLDASCRWSGVNEKTGYFEAGFILEQVPAEFTALVERLRIMRNAFDEA